MTAHHIRLALFLTCTLALGACKPPVDVDTTLEEKNDEKMTMTMRDLTNLDDDYTCTFDETDEFGNQMSGTVYVANAGANIRGEFTLVTDGKSTENTSLIRTNNTNYVWTSSQEQGFMMKLEENEQSLFATSESDADVGIDEEEPVDFHCEKWTPTDGMFVPPANREFVDISARMDAMMEGLVDMQDAMKSQCDSCDLMPNDEAKQQCRQVLNC